MALVQRLDSLKKRHALIKEQIRNEESSPAPDAARLQHLKREKLVLKDEIVRLDAEQEQAA
jgi:hypothetical protein